MLGCEMLLTILSCNSDLGIFWSGFVILEHPTHGYPTGTRTNSKFWTPPLSCLELELWSEYFASLAKYVPWPYAAVVLLAWSMDPK
jgi:hypothetical protein